MRRIGRGTMTALACTAVLAVTACGSGDGDGGSATTPTPQPAPAASAPPEAAASTARPDGPRLELGITEPNPAFVWSPAARPTVRAPFGRWRDALAQVHPARYRLVLEWGKLQPGADRPADLAAPQSGCLRATPPCQAWGGVREQLAALASRQRQRESGWEALVVVTGTPDWAARPPSPCEPPGTESRSRIPRPGALGAYRRLVADVLALARREGAELRWWSPWNEPNHPYFLSPQRTPCDDAQATRSPALRAYVALADALTTTLAEAPGEQELALGELAAIRSGGPFKTGMADWMRALPSPLVCSARVIGQHAYVGGPDPVDALWTAIARHRCAPPPEVWITETGAGPAPASLSAAAAVPAGREAACRALAARLRRWYRDERVTAAFQYTLREDDRFRTGLVRTDLQAAFPTLGLWQAWGARAAPDDPPPAGGC